jgi:hypothetical protein
VEGDESVADDGATGAAGSADEVEATS